MPSKEDFGRPIIDFRQEERRKTHTMLDPSVERRKIRRRSFPKSKIKIIETKPASKPMSRKDRKEILIAAGMFLIALECFLVVVLV